MGEQEMNRKKITLYKSLLFGALFTATLTAGAGAAQAALVSYTGTLAGSSSDPYPNPLLPPLSKDGSITLNQFNSSLGTLNSVTIDLSSAFTYGTQFENKSTKHHSNHY